MTTPPTSDVDENPPAHAEIVPSEDFVTSSDHARKSRRFFSIYRFVVVGVIIIAVGAIVIGVRTTEETQVTATRQGLENVIPTDGKSVLRQATITADLQEPVPDGDSNTIGYSGSLYINGQLIPDDQIVFVAGTRQYSFTPGPTKNIKTLEPGRNCAEIRYWPDDLGPAAYQSYDWCFNVS